MGISAELEVFLGVQDFWQVDLEMALLLLGIAEMDWLINTKLIARKFVDLNGVPKATILLLAATTINLWFTHTKKEASWSDSTITKQLLRQ